MKKIVALVLSLVMVLGLATTAFAAFDEDATYYVAGKTGVMGTTGEYYEVEFVPGEEDTAIAGTVDHFSYDAWTKFVVCEKNDDNAVALYDGNMPGDKKLGYVAVVDVDAVAYEDKATKVDASLYATCTTDKNLKGYVTVDTLGVKSYWSASATPDKYVLVGDEVVGVVSQGAAAVKGGHMLYKNKAAAKDAAETVFEYKCAVCGQVFDAVAQGKKAAGVTYAPYTLDPATQAYYVAAGYSETGVVAGPLWIITDAPAVEAPADKVESAQTFDAGIAMYVGMSVMAAAGSAVVLKKKD